MKKTKLSDETENIKYYEMTLEQIYSKFEVDPKTGLSADQAAISLQIHGLNKIRKKPRSFWRVIISPIINLLIIIYLLVAIALVLFNAGSQTIVTFAILGVNAIVAIVQQLRAEKQLEALKKLSATTAIVIRDGEEVVLPTEEIVIGDIVKFSQGDKIPADCRIIDGINLTLNESSLTGESEPVKKNLTPEPLESHLERTLPIQDQKNMVFLGTFVASGSGKSIVIRIGPNTELGKISLMLEESSTGEIPLRKKMNNFAKYLGVGVLTILLISIIYRTILLSSQNVLTYDNFSKWMVYSLNLSIKVMPINLPLLSTIVLLTGVLIMAQKGVIVRELSSTESLGRVSTVCSDKTGTITKNEMTIKEIWTPSQEYQTTGMGYDPKGIVHKTGEKETIKNQDLDLITISGYLNNNASLKESQVQTLLKGDKKFKNVYHIMGLPTEGALIVLGKKYDAKVDERATKYQFIHEFSFDSAIKRMSKVFVKGKKYFMFTKGATEWLLPLCKEYYHEGNHP
jgi:Ca2+-transporting ATPase